VTASSESDGTIKGDLVGYDINRNAEVVAIFSNGVQSSVGQIAVYHFQNDQGLERVGNSSFRATSNSGEPFFMQNEKGENIVGAKVMTYRLENSNVAMEESLTQLIILQRSYDANAKSVTTADQMMQKALNMDA
jgi:flagellar hook protein FlgE